MSDKEMSDLTPKQRKWLKVYIETGNATEAAMQAYDCKDRASGARIGYENRRKLQGSTRALMEARGLTEGKLWDKLSELLEAMEYRKGQAVPDNKTQIQAAKLLSKLIDVEPADRVEVSGPEGEPVHYEFSWEGVEADEKEDPR